MPADRARAPGRAPLDHADVARGGDPTGDPARGGDPTDGDLTDGDPARRSDRETGARDPQAVLLAVRESALLLATGFVRAPATLRIQAGDVLVEVGWAGEAPAAPVPDGQGPPPAAAGDDGPGAAGEAGGPPAIRSPTVGRFYRSPEPGARPFVEVGDVVAAGQQVAIVETMKLMIPVPAEQDGTIAEVLHADGDDVEHGEALFVLAPA